jgi:preprotein translocase subunit SecF
MLVFSACLVVIAAAVCAFMGGPKLGVEITGGAQITLDMGGAFDEAVVRSALIRAKEDGVSLKTLGATQGEAPYAQLRLGGADAFDAQRSQAIVKEIQQDYPDAAILRMDRVDAIGQRKTIVNGLLALLTALLLISLYAGLRHRHRAALAAGVLALHDVVVMTALVSALRVEIGGAFAAAAVAVAGFSAHVALALFDDVREGQKATPNASLANIVGDGARRRMGRNAFAALVAVAAAGLVAAFGGAGLGGVAIPIAIGVCVSACSGSFLAGALWLWFAGKKTNKPKGQRGATKRA